MFECFCRKQVFIKDVCDELTVLPSLQKPRRISFIGSDGNQYMMMCKAKVFFVSVSTLKFLNVR
jgi:serine/threonine-protein kinase ATR